MFLDFFLGLSQVNRRQFDFFRSCYSGLLGGSIRTHHLELTMPTIEARSSCRVTQWTLSYGILAICLWEQTLFLVLCQAQHSTLLGSFPLSSCRCFLPATSTGMDIALPC